MANNNSPFGFDPIKYLDGADWNGKVITCYIPATDANDMFKGDPVDLTGTSNTVDVGGKKPGTLPVVVKATAGATNRIYGYIVDFIKKEDLSSNYRKASTDVLVQVALANNLICKVQASAGFAATDIGSNTNFLAGSGGDAVSGFSSATIDSTAYGTEATKQFRVLKLYNEAGANDLGDYAIAEVICNLPRISPDNVGV